MDCMCKVLFTNREPWLLPKICHQVTSRKMAQREEQLLVKPTCVLVKHRWRSQARGSERDVYVCHR